MPIYMNNPASGEGQKRSSQGQDAVGRFGPALSAQPGLLGAFGVGGGEVTGFAQSSVLEADVLRGHRLTLRALEPEDFVAWQAARRSMGDEYVAAAGAGDQESFELRCRSLAFASLLGTAVTFGIFAGEDLVGELELALVTAAGMSTGIFSMWLDPSAQGRGLATEAVILVMQHAFEGRDLHRVELPVTPDAPVRRSIEAVHCRDEGIARGYARAEGGWADHVRYALTAEEWAVHRDELLAVATEGQRLDR